MYIHIDISNEFVLVVVVKWYITSLHMSYVQCTLFVELSVHASGI